MTTLIDSLGSPWEENTFEDLLALLAREPLDRSFEACGNFVNPRPVCVLASARSSQDNLTVYPAAREQPYRGLTAFFGNFHGVSFVFSLYTDDPALIRQLTEAIRANQQRPDYLAQAQPARPRPYYLLWPDGTRELITPDFPRPDFLRSEP